MSGTLNLVQIIGHLGRDPESRFMPNGDAVVTFSVATSQRWKDKASGEMQEQTEWHRCVAYRRTAEVAQQYLAKGSHVYLSGRLQTRKWQDKSGADRYSTEIVVDSLQMLDKKGAAHDQDSHNSEQPQREQPRPRAGSKPAPRSPETFDDLDDDIPF